MRALWHGPLPDAQGGSPGLPTGYANQAGIWIPRLADHGWDMGISCLAGVVSHMSSWTTPSGKVLPVYPATPYENLGQDVVAAHYRHFEADLVISLTCTWVYNPDVWRDLRTIFITPVDIPGMSRQDHKVIEQSGGMPAAVCRWGEAQMKARGLDPLYLPHGISTQVFKPPRDRKKLRRAKGLDHMFVIGVNAANHERVRKNYNEIFGAFAQFHAKHPASVLLVHSMAILPEGLNLPAMARAWGVYDAIVWSDQYGLATGAYDQESMAAWYGTLDVLLMPGNEGFGLPTVEAQACGTPVIAGNWGPSPELAGEAGWLLEGQREWNNWHSNHWMVPLISHQCSQCGHTDGFTAVLDEAFHELSDPGRAATRRARARKAAEAWDADKIWADHWLPVVKELEAAGG